MPPLLASVICYSFVAWAFLWDAKAHPEENRTLWIPTIWFMRCGSRGVDAWFGGLEDGRFDPVFVAVMFVVGIIVLARRPVQWAPFVSHNLALFLFYAYLVVSTFWADELENPIIKIFRPLTDLFMALIIVTERDPRDAIITVFRRTAILLIPISILLIKYYPELGRMHAKHWEADAWCGVTTHKNPLGQLTLAAWLAFIWTIADAKRLGVRFRHNWQPWFYLTLCLYLFYGGGDPDSRSTTSLICTFVGTVVFFALGRMQWQLNRLTRRLMGVSFVIGLGFVAMLVLDISPKALVAESQGKGVDLAGRNLIWSETIRVSMKEHPVLGSGYGGFWVPSLFGKLDPRIDNRPMQAHNGYIEVFANLGFVGVLLVIGFIAQSLVSAVRTIRSDFEYGRLRLVFFAVVLLMNYSEATFPVALHIWWFGFLVAAFYAVPYTEWPVLAQTTAGAIMVRVPGVSVAKRS
jgi:exopolysaccharide production protein ExoQ